MRLALIVTVVAVGFTPQIPGFAQAPAGPRVQITFEEGGAVTLKANEASAREILAEWARLGGSIFVGAERLMGGPLTLEFTRQPERDVMASILRQASGYVIGPRRAGTIGASSFEVVYILATSTASTAGYTPAPQIQYQQPQFPTTGAPDDELPPVQGRGAPGPQAPPAPTPTPGPGDYRPSQPGVSGVAVPVVPVVPVTTPAPATGRGGAGSSGS